MLLEKLLENVHAIDEPRGLQGSGGGWMGTPGNYAGSGCDCERDSQGRTVDLCGGRIERTNGSAGCGGVSADVRDFAEPGASADCGRKAGDYQGGGRGGGFVAERRAGLAGEEIDAE